MNTAYFLTGYPWVRVCPEGAAASETEAFEPPTAASSDAHTKLVALLCSRRKLVVCCYVEGTFTATKSYNVGRLSRSGHFVPCRNMCL